MIKGARLNVPHGQPPYQIPEGPLGYQQGLRELVAMLRLFAAKQGMVTDALRTFLDNVAAEARALTD